MGTGKGKFDYWAARVPPSRVIFELSADCHEQVIRDALRLAANKMPGMNDLSQLPISVHLSLHILPGLYEFVKKGDPPVMGITKLSPGVTSVDLMRPRKKLPGEQTAQRLPGTL